MHTWMQLVCPFKFKEMALQRSTIYSQLIYGQPTHQIPDMNETQTSIKRFHYLLENYYSNWNGCTKQTLNSPVLSNA